MKNSDKWTDPDMRTRAGRRDVPLDSRERMTLARLVWEQLDGYDQITARGLWLQDPSDGYATLRGILEKLGCRPITPAR